AGGTMTGLLTLSGPPTAGLNPTSKTYVDTLFAATPLIVTTAGSARVTWTVDETNLGGFRVPGGSMGGNRGVQGDGFCSYTNNSNNKTLMVRWGGTSGATAGGVIGATVIATTTATAQLKWIIRNNNAFNAQIVYGAGGQSPFGTSTQGVATGAIDTSAVD